jgi:ubiquinone/menaquinone biosynthesis C-methylase UbiE
MLSLIRRGFEVTGVDRSPKMLSIASDRVEADARVLAADMRELPMLAAFDLVTCLLVRPEEGVA